MSFRFCIAPLTTIKVPTSFAPFVGLASGDFPGVDVVGPMVPVGRAGTPDDIAGACAYLCSDEASYVTGQVIGVNGGMYL